MSTQPIDAEVITALDAYESAKSVADAADAILTKAQDSLIATPEWAAHKSAEEALYATPEWKDRESAREERDNANFLSTQSFFAAHNAWEQTSDCGISVFVELIKANCTIPQP